MPLTPAPHLHKLDQPKKHYDYDGLTGAWLWFPWWAHLLFAIAMWPLFVWLIPRLPLHQLYLREYFTNNALLFAQGMSAFCLFSATLSFAKAYFLKRTKEDKREEKPKTHVKVPLVISEKSTLPPKTDKVKEIKKPIESAPKVKTVKKTEKTEKIEESEKRTETAVKPKPKKRAPTAKKPDPSQKKSKTATDSTAKKPAVKKKTLKKKADSTKKQLLLDLEN